MTAQTPSQRKGGRPPAELHLQRINVPLRLPRWMVEWIDGQCNKCAWTRAEVIQAALIKAYRLKAPAIRKTP
jgi:hypothetical protein